MKQELLVFLINNKPSWLLRKTHHCFQLLLPSADCVAPLLFQYALLIRNGSYRQRCFSVQLTPTIIIPSAFCRVTDPIAQLLPFGRRHAFSLAISIFRAAGIDEREPSVWCECPTAPGLLFLPAPQLSRLVSNNACGHSVSASSPAGAS